MQVVIFNGQRRTRQSTCPQGASGLCQQTVCGISIFSALSNSVTTLAAGDVDVH
ncbi:MAG: hypothetical protein JRE64_20805 [Deltaproteobacteria bacterium]|nr:hypothetical protein [Deltaproteobacteria bacterium]